MDGKELLCSSKRLNKLVEGRGIVVRTRVRFPSTPLEAVETNGCPTAQIAVFKNVFSVILYVDMSAEYEDAVESDVITFKMIQDWILYTYDVSVSNSSITQVKEKCGLDKLRIDSAVLESNPKLKSKKEKYVFDAFKYFKIVS